MLTNEPIERSIRSGVHLSNYQILSHLISGNTGEFWLALRRSGGEGQIYVTKTLQARLDMDHTFVERFWHQAMQASQLEHPNIVQLIDGGMSSGVQFLVMEYVPGRSLDQILLKRPMPPLWFTLKIGIQICDALHYAHTLKDPENPDAPQMIHGCLAPKKVMISCNGVVRVLGFGIAQVASMIQDIPSTVRLSRFAYLSPEHLRGVTLEHHCDIYGVGVLLYELLTGQRPFSGNSVFHLIQRIAEGNPKPITQINNAVPVELEEIVLQAMHVRTDKRHTSAGELRDKLKDVFNSLSARSSSQVLSTYLRDLFPEIPWAEKNRDDPAQLLSGTFEGPGTAAEEADEVTKTGKVSATMIESAFSKEKTTAEYAAVEAELPPEVAAPKPKKGAPKKAAPKPALPKPSSKSTMGKKSEAKPAAETKAETDAEAAPEPKATDKPETNAEAASKPAPKLAVKPSAPALPKPSAKAPAPQKLTSRPATAPSLAKPATAPSLAKPQTAQQKPEQVEEPAEAAKPVQEAAAAKEEKPQATSGPDIFATYAAQRRKEAEADTKAAAEKAKTKPAAPAPVDVFGMYASRRSQTLEEEAAAKEAPAPREPSGSEAIDVFSRYGGRKSSSDARDPFSPASKNPFAPPGDLPGGAKTAFGGNDAVRSFETGLVYFRSGKYHEALVEWERALELDPENRTYRSNIQRLRSLMKKK